MSITVQGNVYIFNTRTDGQHSNILVMNNSNGVVSPGLHVWTPSAPTNSLWNIVQDSPGGLYRIEMAVGGETYVLAVSVGLTPVPNGQAMNGAVKPMPNGTLVTAYSGNTPSGYFDGWMMPYDTRILSGYGICASPTNSAVSLDAGQYPDVIVWGFNSNVSQTWAVSSSYPSF
ncbi:hypothetical protein [Caulobacter sp. BP25]|uniref:hypothetical protein n=1 Tax=Caulobacter sp. BP25 TaxID=2048900 RepID=UPI00117E36DC|nr:hypothetical protein [Caulobacter sp. BP25]